MQRTAGTLRDVMRPSLGSRSPSVDASSGRGVTNRAEPASGTRAWGGVKESGIRPHFACDRAGASSGTAGGAIDSFSPMHDRDHDQILARSVGGHLARIAADPAAFVMDTAPAARFYGDDGVQYFPRPCLSGRSRPA